MSFRLFERFGVELEYMIVQRESGAVVPAADRLLAHFGGPGATDCVIGRCEASNELAAHVFELKAPEPVSQLEPFERDLHQAAVAANQVLDPMGCRLLGGPMHPTMNPAKESATWQGDGSEVYGTYDRIFNCRGHGWFNLQSCHLNLPFRDDEEFAQLHTAIVLLLPLIPALSAGSPFREGQVTGLADTRLDTYRRNQERFPSIAGLIIPETVFS
jgi:glutamate---cysteine ligase / carboxylate-amine ligase